MSPSEIQKLYKQCQSKARRYYDYYQQGGGTQYYCHYRTYDNIAWLCQHMLEESTYATDSAVFKNFIAGIFNDACKCFHTNSINDYQELGRKIREFGKFELNLTNPWS